MAITTSGGISINPLDPGVYLVSLGTGGLDGTGTAAATVLAGATLDVGIAGEATPTAITFTTLAVGLGSIVNFVGGADAVGTLVLAGGVVNVTNGGSLTIDQLGPVSSLSTFNIGTGASLVLGPAVTLSALENIDFAGSTGTLVVSAQSLSVNLLTGITDFQGGDQLTVLGVNYDAALSSYDGASHTLNLVTTTGATQQVNLSGTAGNASLANQYFHVANTAAGATIYVDGNAANGFVACYGAGTLIRTARGDVAVESLQIGDEVVTVSGDARPLRWIGQRSYGGRFLASNPAMQPVRIAADALADGVPSRDLTVSRKHAMLIDGVLMPAECLVNGTTIYVDPRSEVHYFHLELESHDAIWAEDAASETFLDDDSRGMFHNAATFAALYPGLPQRSEGYCAPRVETGYQLEVARHRLALRAGGRQAA